MRILTLIVILFSSFAANTQVRLSLEDCIGLALKNNLTVQRAYLNAELAEQDFIGAKGQHLPSINLFLNSDLNFGRTIDPFTNTFATDEVRSDAYGIQGRWDVFTGASRYNRYKQANMNVLASRYDSDKARNDVSLSVTSSYLQILFNEELLRVAEQQVRLSQGQVNRSKKFVEAGRTAEGDLLDLVAQMAREELNVVNASNSLDISKLRLLLLMRADSIDEFSVTRPSQDVSLLKGNEATSSFIYYKALESLPEIKSAEIKYEASSSGLNAERGRISPTISLRGSLGSGYSGKNLDLVTRNTKDFGTQVTDNFNQSIGVSLTMPILNSLSTHTAVSRAKVTREIRELELQQAKNQVNETIKQAYFDANASKKKYDANVKAVDATKESFKYATKRYEVGNINGIEYNQSKTNLARAEADLVRAKYDYLFKFKILEFYQGKPLSLN